MGDDLFADATLKGQSGDVKGSSLNGKVFGLYFSAHWCPPCRGFTPKLAEWYKKDLQAKGFEVVFVSSDKDEASFKEYSAEQPWLALDFADRKRKDQLSTFFGVEGIPSFVIIDKDGSVITKDGRAAVTGDPTGADFPWYPKPVVDLKNGPGSINEVTTLLVFCETSEEGLSGKIRGMVSLPDVEATSKLAPRLILLDIPDNGGFYTGPEGEISTEVVRKFLADYSAKTLTRQQLS